MFFCLGMKSEAKEREKKSLLPVGGNYLTPLLTLHSSSPSFNTTHKKKRTEEKPPQPLSRLCFIFFVSLSLLLFSWSWDYELG